MRSSSTLGADQIPEAVDKDAPGMLPANSDQALREALRNLQLSPDMIDTSAAAIYAHVRDPIEHPVDKELARLCTSEYTRGALHALCLYLVAVSNESEVNGRTERKSLLEAKAIDTSAPSAKGSRAGATALSPGAGTNGNSKAGNGPLADSVSEKLSTFWNRMRRTRSMPAKGHGVILPTEADLEDEDGDGEGHGFPTNDQRPSSGAAFPPKLSVRVGATPRSPRRGNNLLAGLGLGSPSGRAAGEVATPRRAPVRTGHWKLGHEIGKGSFGAVHIGLNEDTGVSWRCWVRGLVLCFCFLRVQCNKLPPSAKCTRLEVVYRIRCVCMSYSSTRAIPPCPDNSSCHSSRGFSCRCFITCE